MCGGLGLPKAWEMAMTAGRVAIDRRHPYCAELGCVVFSTPTLC